MILLLLLPPVRPDDHIGGGGGSISIQGVDRRKIGQITRKQIYCLCECVTHTVCDSALLWLLSKLKGNGNVHKRESCVIGVMICSRPMLGPRLAT